MRRSTCIGFAALMLGCIGDVRDGEASLDEDDPQGLIDPGDLIDVDPGRLVPWTVRVHTCNESNAQTTNYVTLTTEFQEKVGTSLAWRSHRISLTDAGKTRNSWNEYSLIFDQLPSDLSLLHALLFRKEGRDASCVDRVELRYKGYMRWSFDAGDAGSESYLVARPAGNLWLDDDYATNTPTGSLRFSDLTIVDGQAAQSKTALEFETCAVSGGNAHPGTTDKVTVTFKHDGITEVFPLDGAESRRGAGEPGRILLDEHGVRTIQSVSITKTGTNDWCLAAFRLWSGPDMLTEASAAFTLNSGSGAMPTYTLPVNKTVGGASTSQKAQVGLPLKRSPGWIGGPYADIVSYVEDIQGCGDFDVVLDVHNQGDLAGEADVNVGLSARGRAFDVWCQGGDNAHCDSDTPVVRPRDFQSSSSDSVHVKVKPGEHEKVIVPMSVALPQYIYDVQVEAMLHGIRGLHGRSESWSNPTPGEWTPSNVCL